MYDMFASQAGAYGFKKPDAYNPYAAGQKMYGYSGRNNATEGPVTNRTGYDQRDMETRAKKAALLGRLKANNAGQLYPGQA